MSACTSVFDFFLFLSSSSSTFTPRTRLPLLLLLLVLLRVLMVHVSGVVELLAAHRATLRRYGEIEKYKKILSLFGLVAVEVEVKTIPKVINDTAA